MVPMGYDTRDRKITVNEREAETVRTIFRRYLELGSLHLLMADLRARGIVTKVRRLKTGKTVGGMPFTRGPLAHLLRNPFYVGEVPFKGEIFKGEQPAMVDRDLFEAVQARLTEQANHHQTARMRSDALLKSRIFDDRGNRMTPSHTRKGGIKYPYYLSSALLQGMAERAGSVSRVPAAEIETLVVKSVRDHLKLAGTMDDRSVVETQLARMEVQQERLIIYLMQSPTFDQQLMIARPCRSHGPRHPRRAVGKSFYLQEPHRGSRGRFARRAARSWSHRLRAAGGGLLNFSQMPTPKPKVSQSASGAVFAK
jgi:hypothetical protein